MKVENGCTVGNPAGTGVVTRGGSFFVDWPLFFISLYHEATKLEEKAGEARAQLKEYLQSDDLRRVSRLAAYAIVFVGSEARSVEQVEG